MGLEDIVTDSVYSTLVADDATYIDASGDQIAVRVVHEHDSSILLGEAEIGVRGPRQAFRMRKSALTFKPCAGDHLAHSGTSYCIDGAPVDLNQTEWLIHVVA